ncbi:MAG: ABC transporter permease subunit [Caldilineaceae bacterium]
MRTLLDPLAILIGIIIYAYGFQVTQVDLDELGSPTRQESLTRILRALARPDFVEYEQEEFQVETPIYVPCPAGGAPEAAVEQSGPYMVVTPPCADPETEVTVEGFNFAPNTEGPLNFIPPSAVSLQLGRIATDGSGHFALTVKLRDRTSPEPQLLRAVTRRSIGGPRLSQNGIDTIDKILETVFMALLATTAGTALAIPVSFFAAQNLMRTVTSPVPSIALSILAAPLGILIGGEVASWLANLGQPIANNLAANAGGLVAIPLLLMGMMRWVAPPADTGAEAASNRLVQIGALLLAGIGGILLLLLMSNLAVSIGQLLTPRLGAFGFLGDFVAKLGEILRLLIAPICALITAGVLMNLAGQLGQKLVERATDQLGWLLNLLLAALAGAVLFLLIGLAGEWLYEIRNPMNTRVIPALVGAVAGLSLGLRTRYDDSLPVGLAIYSVTRTVLNALRSIEALIMVIVFAVWVGIGPFAGVLALGLHTVAALAKLYSEQVESIMAGPLEAVLAAGANRLQMIVYAVIPQIVPPYISFTMYRWDINVRMSTIIGFAGGGGIGFLLQQNINLLNYRAASAQIFAIAIVVSLMDYLSSALRQRVV